MKNSIIFDQIFEYKIVDIKKGGMGEVLILDRISNQNGILEFIHQKKIAAKTFKAQIPDNKIKFEREISIWLNFHDYIFENSRIVKLLKTTYIRNKLYALMPFYEKNLADIIRTSKKMGFNEAITVINDIVKGLQSVFEKYGVVHQDLKPDNILCKRGFNARDEFHISDWGISNIQRNMCPEIPTHQWLPDSFVEIMSNTGTLPYMSPERFLGDYSNLSSDIYAIGLIFFEMIFGYLPLDAVKEKPLELQIMEGDYYDFACWLMNKEINNQRLNRFIQTCIHPNPSKRYTDYKNLSKSLKQINKKWIFF